MLAATRPLPVRPRRRLPVIGHLPAMLRDPLGTLDRWAKEVGDLYRIDIPSRPTWVVNRPSEIERVLTAPRAFRKDKDLQNARSLFGDGLLTSEGDLWIRQRRLAQPAFHRDRIAAYGERMVALAAEAADRWSDGETRDVHADMMELTLRIATETLFGDGAVSAREVGDALEAVLERFEGSSFVLPEWMPIGAPARYREAIRRLDAVVYGVIERRRQSDEPRDDLLSLLLAAVDEDGSKMSDRQLRDEVLTLLLAGHETTANTLTWTWHLLSLHPEVERKLYDKVSALGGAPTAADAQKLSFTNAVVLESNRLFPPAWVLGREALTELEVGGFTMAKGTQVWLSQWVVHRDERFFPAPLEFRPERWLDGSTKGIPAYAYFPFGGGQRLCIGKGFAQLEAVLVLATLAARFRFESTGHPARPRPSITLRPHGGLPMRLRRR